MIHAYLYANFEKRSDIRFLFDLMRVYRMIKDATKDQEVEIRCYSNPDVRTWEYFIKPMHQNMAHDLTEEEMRDFTMVEHPALQHTSEFSRELMSVEGLTKNDRVFIYITGHGVEDGVSIGLDSVLSVRQIVDILDHFEGQGAGVLLFLSACSSQKIIRDFGIQYLKGTESEKKNICIFTDDSSIEGGQSYNIELVPAELEIGTEFCHVFLTLLDRLKTQTHPDTNPSIRGFHMGFPDKFRAFYGRNANQNLSDYFGANIVNYDAPLCRRPAGFVDYVSFTNFNGDKVVTCRSLISPKLFELLRLLLGHEPTDAELSIELSDKEYVEHHDRILEITTLLRVNKFIVPGKFPGGNAVYCMLNMLDSDIVRGIKQINERNVSLKSNVK
ncbi:hypothetical protein AKO1_000568 [Acrasis kona]|uniref:CHAT domain-containing protein n=1 Tax=Acrasis kona TaxID=1008807 RepID=A0AAW2ZPD4_9EUKA